MSSIELRYSTSDPVRYLAALDFVYSLLIQIADNVTQTVAENHPEAQPIENETAGNQVSEATIPAATMTASNNEAYHDPLYNQSQEMPI